MQKYSYPVLLILALIGFISGFLINRQLPKASQQTQIPLPPEFIVSPLIDTFYANVEGKVMDKGKDYMVLQKDNNNIQILIEESIGRTTFAKQSGKTLTEIHFNDVKIGDYLKGGISIDVKGVKIVGHRFTVI